MPIEILENKKLKKATFWSPQTGKDNQFERYVVESLDDLTALIKVFPKMKISRDIFRKSIQRGYKILIGDPHGFSGYNPYCYETVLVDGEEPHVHSFIRFIEETTVTQ